MIKFLILFLSLYAPTLGYSEENQEYTNPTKTDYVAQEMRNLSHSKKVVLLQGEFHKKIFKIIIKKGTLDLDNEIFDNSMNIPKFSKPSKIRDTMKVVSNVISHSTMSFLGAVLLSAPIVLSIEAAEETSRELLNQKINQAYAGTFALVGLAAQVIASFPAETLSRFLSERKIFQRRNTKFLAEKNKYYKSLIFGYMLNAQNKENTINLGIHHNDFNDVVRLLIAHKFLAFTH